MQWTSYFIKKPVLSLSICCLLFFMGIFSLKKMTLRLMPEVDIPIVSVETGYPGASAKTIQSTVTYPLQNTFFTLPGIEYIQSSTVFGRSRIQLHFKMDYKNQAILNDVANKVFSVKHLLPESSEDSVIQKVAVDDKPAFIIAFTSEDWAQVAVNDFLRRKVKPRLELIPNVAVDVMGESPALRIWLDSNRLEENQLTPLDIANVLKAQTFSAALGIKKERETEYSLDANNVLSEVEEFNQLIIKSLGDNVLRLKDIAHVNLGAESDLVSTVVNGTPATMVFIKLLSGANPLDIGKKLQSSLDEIKKILPSTLRLMQVYDATQYIHFALWDLAETTLLTLGLIVLIVYAFLGHIRATLIPVISIPLSLVSSGTLLWLAHCSINTVTLLAMVIAIGLVVDDAIVMLENIYRGIEKGMLPYQAALQGAKEMAGPVISISLIFSIAFLPIIFLNGMAGKIFGEFALTLASSVLISGIIAIVLTPLMCAKMLFTQRASHSITQKITNALANLQRYYYQLLIKIFKKRQVIILFYLCILLLSGFLYHFLPKELAPREDQGFLQIIGDAPIATTKNYLRKYTGNLDQIYKRISDINRYIYINNIPEEHQFLSFVSLQSVEKRQHSASELRQQLQAALDEITGVRATVVEPSTLPVSNGLPVQFVLKGDLPYEKLYQMSEVLKAKALKTGKFIFIDQDVHFNKPQYILDVDRLRAENLEVNFNDIMMTISLLLGEKKLQQFTFHGENYPIILHDKDEIRSLESIHVKAQNGQFVPLASLLELKKSVTADALNQFQKMNSVTLSGVLSPGKSLAAGLDYLEKTLGELSDKKEILIDYAGESRELINERQQNTVLLASAICLIYFTLAILFESFYLPWIVLFACLPGTFFSALLALFITHNTLNIYTEIGMMTLLGLICKHGILLIQYAEKARREQRLSHYDAIMAAAALRFRPIMMTTVAMLLGTFPLLFATSMGSKSHFDLGIVISSGTLFGTFAALFLVPLFYIPITPQDESLKYAS